MNLGYVGKTISVAAAIVLPLIVVSEGVRTKAFLDPVGIPTVCYGRIANVKMTDQYTPEQCVVQLKEDMQAKEAAVDRLLKVEVSPYTKAALIDFAYNAGEANLSRSSMLRHINAGDTRKGCEAFATCVTYSDGRKSGWGCGFAKGVQLKGLIKRRIEERNLCMKGVNP